uniref:Uncharacterized protein n=1 Tax=Pelusios castaneus TaxID=367368 RepID=A0A8C8RGQ5_9SAUR
QMAAQLTDRWKDSWRGREIPWTHELELCIFSGQGTNVIPLLFSVHNDPTQFKDPAMFNPTHFLDERGSFQKNDALMAFSAGKRLCLGESLARMELFLFFTTVLQCFTLMPLVQPEEIDLSPLMKGIGNVPPLYKCRAIPR